MIGLRERIRTYDIMEYRISGDSGAVRKGQLPEGMTCVIVSDEKELAILRSQPNDFWEPEKLYALAKREQGVMFAILAGNRPAAFGVLLKKGSKGAYFRICKSDAYIGGLFTFPEYRNKGCVTAMMYEMMSYAKRNWQAERITLCVRPDNLRASHVYENIGFRKMGTKTCLMLYKYRLPYHKI